MAINTPKIRTVISGDNITQLDTFTSFTVTEKLERDQLIKASDGLVTIDYSYINNPRSIVLQSLGSFVVTITYTDLTPVTHVIPFGINNGMFRFDPVEGFDIDSIKISTASTTDLLVNTRIFGIAATV